MTSQLILESQEFCGLPPDSFSLIMQFLESRDIGQPRSELVYHHTSSLKLVLIDRNLWAELTVHQVYCAWSVLLRRSLIELDCLSILQACRIDFLQSWFLVLIFCPQDAVLWLQPVGLLIVRSTASHSLLSESFNFSDMHFQHMILLSDPLKLTISNICIKMSLMTYISCA